MLKKNFNITYSTCDWNKKYGSNLNWKVLFNKIAKKNFSRPTKFYVLKYLIKKVQSNGYLIYLFWHFRLTKNMCTYKGQQNESCFNIHSTGSLATTIEGFNSFWNGERHYVILFSQFSFHLKTFRFISHQMIWKNLNNKFDPIILVLKLIINDNEKMYLIL